MSPQPHQTTRGITGAAKASMDRAAAQRSNGGATAHARKMAEQTPAELWESQVDGVLERFKADMALRYPVEESPQLPFDWARVDCPMCGVDAGQRCRSVKTRRTTDPHKARIDAGAAPG